jgi:hypothetical protein
MPTDGFVFAYGSLTGAAGARAARLRDHRRVWGIAIDNALTVPGYKAYLAPDGSRPAVCVAFLDVQRAPGAYVRGELLPVDRSALRVLDRRERNYDRVDVSALVDGAPAGARVWTFRGLPAARERLARARAAGRAVVHAAYARAVAPHDGDTVPHGLPVAELERVELPPATLERDGYVLVPDVAGPDVLARLAREDSGDGAAWLRAVVARALARDDVRVCGHGLAVRPPGDPALPIHWDADPRTAGPAYGGLVHLTDTPLSRGPFRAVPSLFRDVAGWFERHPGAGTRPGDLWDIDVQGHASVPVPGCAGDLLLWDVRLPHGDDAVTGDASRVSLRLSARAGPRRPG